MPTPATASVPLPVTVSVTRHVDPTRSSEMLAWCGPGSARPSGTSSTGSPTPPRCGRGRPRPGGRGGWGGRGQHRVTSGGAAYRHRLLVRRAPLCRDGRGAGRRSGSRRSSSGWRSPAQLLVTWLTGTFTDLPLVPRVLLSTVLLTPVMTYVVLPRVTAALSWWLRATGPLFAGAPRHVVAPNSPGDAPVLVDRGAGCAGHACCPAGGGVRGVVVSARVVRPGR